MIQDAVNQLLKGQPSCPRQPPPPAARESDPGRARPERPVLGCARPERPVPGRAAAGRPMTVAVTGSLGLDCCYSCERDRKRS